MENGANIICLSDLNWCPLSWMLNQHKKFPGTLYLHFHTSFILGIVVLSDPNICFLVMGKAMPTWSSDGSHVSIAGVMPVDCIFIWSYLSFYLKPLVPIMSWPPYDVMHYSCKGSWILRALPKILWLYHFWTLVFFLFHDVGIRFKNF